MEIVKPPLEPVHFSRLKFMGQSPAHYRDALLTPIEETVAMEKGTGLHSILLGGKEVTFYPGKVRNGKEWEKFEADNAHKHILTRADYEKVNRAADSVRANRDAMDLLSGEKEVTIDWEFLGRSCQSRLDVYGGFHVTELKFTMTSHPDRLPWQARKMGWPAQLAFYDMAARYLGGDPNRRHDLYIIAVESKRPYPPTVFQLQPRAIDKGMAQVRLWFERLLSCEATDEWPGYVQSIVPLDEPDDADAFAALDAGDDETEAA